MDDRRYEQFEQGVSEMKLNVGTSAESWYARIGGVAAIAGPVLGLVAYLGSVGTDDARRQSDMIVLGLLAVAITVFGIGLFLRYSVVRFFRFWAARIVYELNHRASEPLSTNDKLPPVRIDREVNL